MNQKSDIELERALLVKDIRTLVRLKHSKNADIELNEILPEYLDEFDTAIQTGELKQLTAKLLAELLES